MKQPELGRKILEWRKAKGLTQEELVDLCQINVRTIQRIESGEVTPRSFTLKTILSALEVDPEIVNDEQPQVKAETSKLFLSESSLKISFYLGIVYLLLAIVEGVMEFTIWNDSVSSITGVGYTTIKFAILITFSIFTYGFYALSKQKENPLVTVGAVLLLVGIILSTGKDLYVFYLDRESYLQFAVIESIYFGFIYILFAIGVLNYQKLFGPIALVAGCLGILTGLAFMSVIFAIPGLFILTVFEILLLVLLFNASHKMGSAKMTGPFYSFSN